MGKKNKATTKSGKFVNPTDRARKEERKRELKKNKKQRLAVRTAVIKGKDPNQILAELERLDQMEFNVNQPSVLNEKVLMDKRRKLKDGWDRIVRLYFKEDKEMYTQLKRLESEYEVKREEMRKHYEAVKSAENVSLEDIPLPALPPSPPSEPYTIRKAPVLTSHRSVIQKEPPGPLPGPPPNLDEFEEDSSMESSGISTSKSKESDVDEFLKEIDHFATTTVNPSVPPHVVPPPIVIPRHPPPGLPPLPSQPVLSQPFKLPGQTPLIPLPGSLRPPLPPSPMKASHPLQQKPTSKTDKTKPVATIEAKPQLRNLSADATRFMPLALRVKRNEKQPARPKTQVSQPSTSTTTGDTAQSKDEAYEQFMKELEGLL